MKILATVDSIEGDLANLLLRGKNGEKPLGVFPLSALPEGVKAGDILSLHFEREEEETEAARRRIEEIRRRLVSGE